MSESSISVIGCFVEGGNFGVKVGELRAECDEPSPMTGGH
jgi:hypothetical protein